MKTVMTIVGTRPEIIKLSRVLAELEKYTNHIQDKTMIMKCFLMKWVSKNLIIF